MEAPAESRFAIRQWVAQAEHDAESRGERGPSRVLTSYLDSPDSAEMASEEALAVIESAQVIFARYEHDPSTKGERIVRSTDKPGTVPNSHQPKLPVTLALSRFWGDAEDMPAEQWIEHLKQPLGDGYRLKSLTVTVAPERQDLQAFQRQYLATYRDELVTLIAATEQQFVNVAGNASAMRRLDERIRELQAELSRVEEGLNNLAAQFGHK